MALDLVLHQARWVLLIAALAWALLRPARLRIEGLYFDRHGDTTNRVVSGNTVRVGLSAQSYPFPAPTGIAGGNRLHAELAQHRHDCGAGRAVVIHHQHPWALRASIGRHGGSPLSAPACTVMVCVSESRSPSASMMVTVKEQDALLPLASVT